MMGFNQVVLTGKVAAAPALEYVAGSAVCRFSIRIGSNGKSRDVSITWYEADVYEVTT